jgi:hypothetical protein
MKTISVKALRPVKMTAKTLIFEDPNHGVYMATRRVANDILTGIIDEVFIVDTILPNKHHNDGPHPVQMLATPSCW